VNRAHNVRAYFEPGRTRVLDRTAPGEPQLAELAHDAATQGAGASDLVWRNALTGELVVWHLDGAGVRDYEENTNPNRPPDPLDWTVAGPR